MMLKLPKVRWTKPGPGSGHPADVGGVRTLVLHLPCPGAIRLWRPERKGISELSPKPIVLTK